MGFNRKEAMEKQKAKKPYFDEDNLPCCGACKSSGIRQGMFDEIGGLDELYYQFNYCANCGQKVDWSEIPAPSLFNYLK